jgi:hypothetical protein
MLQPAPVQSIYTRYQPIGQNGDLASSINFSADTRIVETAAGIGFGLAVSQGVLSDAGCVIGGSAFVGVTRRDVTIARADLSATPGQIPQNTYPVDLYPQSDNVGVLVTGDIWVNCYASVTPATAVTFSATTGQFGLAGTTITDARWMTTAVGSAGTPALAVLRLGSPTGK